MAAVKPRVKKPVSKAPVAALPAPIPPRPPKIFLPLLTAAFLGGLLGGLVVLLAGRSWVETRLAAREPHAEPPRVMSEEPRRATPRPRKTPKPSRPLPTAIPLAVESEDLRQVASLLQEGEALKARLDPCRAEPSGQEAADLCDAWKDKTFAALTRIDADLVAAFDSPGRGSAHAYVPAACDKFRDEISVLRQDMERHLAALAEIRQRLRQKEVQ